METLTLPVEDWESLQNLALGTSVLQLGFCDGTDTVTLAQTASMVMAVCQSPDALCVHSSNRFWSWDRTVHDAGRGDKVIGTSHPWATVIALWPAKAFGLAVVNPWCFDGPQLRPALHFAGHLADRVAVIDPGPDPIKPIIGEVFVSEETSIVHSGHLWVIKAADDRVPADSAVI